jgi:hypothetical protein
MLPLIPTSKLISLTATEATTAWLPTIQSPINESPPFGYQRLSALT